MSVPHYQDLFTPILRLLADGRDWKKPDLEAALAREFRLTEAEIAEPSAGAQPQKHLTHQISHAKARLNMVKLIASPRRGVHRITDLGRRQLGDGRRPLTEADLRRMPGYKLGR